MNHRGSGVGFGGMIALIVIALILGGRTAPSRPAQAETRTPSLTASSTAPLSATEMEATLNAAIEARFTETAFVRRTVDYQTATAQFLATVNLRFNRALTATALAPARTLAALQGLALLSLATIEQITQVGSYRTVFAVNALSLSPDGMILAMVSNTETGVRLVEVSSGREINALLPLSVATPTPTTVILSTLTPTPTPIPTIEGPVGMYSVSFSPGETADGVRIAGGNALGNIYVWDAITGEELLFLPGHAGIVFTLAFSPDGSILASGSADGTVRLWDVATGRPLGRLVGHNSAVSSLAFSPDGSLLASGALGGRAVRLWTVRTGQPAGLLQGHTGGVLSVAFSPDGTRLASGSRDGTIRLWDSDLRQKTPLFVLPAPNGVTHLSFSPDGTILAAGGIAPTVTLYDPFEGRVAAVLDGHIGGVTALGFSPDGTRLAAVGLDRIIRYWGVRLVQ